MLSDIKDKIREWYKDSWLEKFVYSSPVAKLIVTIVVWLIAMIPTEFIVVLWWIVGPVGFWQKFAMIAIPLCLGGWIQIILIGAAVIVTIGIIAEDF